MSGPRAIWNDGQGVETPDLQSMADHASAAEDRAADLMIGYAASAGLGVYMAGKSVFPWYQEFLASDGHLLCVPSVVAGEVLIRPAYYTQRDLTTFQVAISGKAETSSKGPFASTTANNRRDLIYATVSRTVQTTGARKIKAIADGALSSQTVNLTDLATVAFTILAGTEGGSPSEPALPADSATAFHFRVASVLLSHPYTAGDAITQAKITQLWDGAWIHPRRVPLFEPMTLHRSTDAGKPTTPLYSADRAGAYHGNQWGAGVSKFVTFKHSTNPQTIVLDESIDWRKRMIEIQSMICVQAETGVYPPVQSVTKPGAGDYLLGAGGTFAQFTGDGGTTGASTYTTAGTSATMTFFADSATGALKVTIAGATNGGVDNHWAGRIVASDRFSW